MDKNKLNEIKKRLLALELTGVMLGAVGCANNVSEDGIPYRESIPKVYSSIENYYKMAIQNGKAVKLYKAENVYLLFNKETYEVNEYIFDTVLGQYGGQLYDLESEELLVYSMGLGEGYNEKYNDYLRDTNYPVCLKNAGDYIEGYIGKEYYSLNDIKELAPLIADSLIIINLATGNTK